MSEEECREKGRRKPGEGIGGREEEGGREGGRMEKEGRLEGRGEGGTLSLCSDHKTGTLLFHGENKCSLLASL